MRTEQILKADVLDIIFDNRNKSYGAYELRKLYKQRLGKAMGLVLLMAAGFFTFIEYGGFKKVRIAEKPFIPDVRTISILEEVKIEAPKPEQPKPQTKKVASQIHVANIIITKKESEATPLAKNLDSVAIGSATNEGDGNAKLLVKGTQPGTMEAPVIKTPEASAVDKTTPMLAAEVMPSFPGGMEGLRKYLQKNLQNPVDMDEGEMVIVKIKFVVGYDGKLKAFETVQDGGRVFNNEVMRVLRKMPDWTPGKSRGENVSVYYTIPVKFTSAY